MIWCPNYRRLFLHTRRFYCSSAKKYKKPPEVLIKRVAKLEPPELGTHMTTQRFQNLYEYNAEWEKSDPYAHSLAKPDYFGVQNLFTLEEMMQARVHLGHKVGLQDGNMNKYILGERMGVSIIDLDQTMPLFNAALNVLAHVAFRKGIIVFVTNEKHTIHMVEKCAKECGEYSLCHPQPKGLFTNSEVKFGQLVRLPDAMIFLSCIAPLRKPHMLIREAAKLGILTVGVVDSDITNPTMITYPIPGNDDSVQATQFYLKYIKLAILAGKKKRLEEFGDDRASESMSVVYQALKRMVEAKEGDTTVGDQISYAEAIRSQTTSSQRSQLQHVTDTMRAASVEDDRKLFTDEADYDDVLEVDDEYMSGDIYTGPAADDDKNDR